MKEDIFSINSVSNIIIFANKTNICKATPEQYKKLLRDNVKMTDKKSSDLLKKTINMEVKRIAKKLVLSDRVEQVARNPTFVALKES